MSHGEEGYVLVAIKRPWVPEWLFAMFKWAIPFWPFRWVFTQRVFGGLHRIYGGVDL